MNGVASSLEIESCEAVKISCPNPQAYSSIVPNPSVQYAVNETLHACLAPSTHNEDLATKAVVWGRSSASRSSR